MTNDRTQYSNKGYTLIEILVGLTIVSVLFAIGYINFRDFARRQTLDSTAKLLQGDVSLAQQMALSGTKPDDPACNDPNTLTGIRFRIYTASEYLLVADCTGGVVTVKIVNLPSGIVMSFPTPNPIEFKVLGQGTNIPEGSTATIILTQTGTTNSFTETINSGGQLQ